MSTVTVVERPKYDLKDGVRKLGANNILTQGVEDMIDAIKADTMRLVHNAEGTKYLHILNNKTEEYFSVKVGAKVTSRKKGEDLITDLVENHIIYTGVTENGVWFTFGPAGEVGEADAEISLKELMANKVKFYSGK